MLYDDVKSYTYVTPDQLARCMPGCDDPESWAGAFEKAIGHFAVPNVAMLLAQVGHESNDLADLEESLWYSAGRLIEVWPSRFPGMNKARQFAENPEKLANEVYGGRMGNTEPGDGWRFHGRGPIQITGRYNYQALADAISDQGVVNEPETLLQPKRGALSATWYFMEHVREEASINEATQSINGGLNGIDDRKRRYNECREILNGNC